MFSGLSSGDVLNLKNAMSSRVCALEPLVRELLALLSRASAAVDSPESTAASQQLDRLSHALLTERERAPELTPTILAEVQAILERAIPVRSAAKELAAALSLIRDAILGMTTDEHALRESLTQSVDRLDSLRDVTDFAELRAAVAREVDTLRAVAVARETQWQSRVTHLEQKIRAFEDQLEESRLEATHDPVTGLVNRRTVQATFRNYQASVRQFVLALVDVDDFKSINDALGHLGGDAALRAVGTALQTSVRGHDLVGRFGGDEFVVLMFDVTLAQAEHRFRALVKTLHATPLAGDRKLTVSCGIAEFSAGDSFESLIERADKGLYDAKRSGKNRVVSKAAPYIRDLRRAHG